MTVRHKGETHENVNLAFTFHYFFFNTIAHLDGT